MPNEVMLYAILTLVVPFLAIFGAIYRDRGGWLLLVLTIPVLGYLIGVWFSVRIMATGWATSWATGQLISLGTALLLALWRLVTTPHQK